VFPNKKGPKKGQKKKKHILTPPISSSHHPPTYKTPRLSLPFTPSPPPPSLPIRRHINDDSPSGAAFANATSSSRIPIPSVDFPPRFSPNNPQPTSTTEPPPLPSLSLGTPLPLHSLIPSPSLQHASIASSSLTTPNGRVMFRARSLVAKSASAHGSCVVIVNIVYLQKAQTGNITGRKRGEMSEIRFGESSSFINRSPMR
ncbi:hypothetical protein L249_3089, partial [Ophiocordyceps polyrhachis-furcata BCC 54312]